MTVVSSQEFATHQDKYLEMAVNSDVHIQKGQKMFKIVYKPALEEQPVLEPDADFYRALSAEEFREKLMLVLDKVDKKYAK